MKKLKEILFLSDKGYTDLKKAIIACTITNLAMLLPFCITVMVFRAIKSFFRARVRLAKYLVALGSRYYFSNHCFLSFQK